MVNEVSAAGVVEKVPFDLLGLQLNEVATIAIALMALFVTVYQSWRQRKHDRLSVRPYLTFVEEHEHHNGEIVFTLELANYGIGPAFIDSHRVMHGVPGSAEYREADLKKELNELLELEFLRTVQINDSHAIPANQKESYLELKLKSSDKEGVEMIRTALYEFVIEINYKCIYGDRTSLSTNDITQKYVPALSQRDHKVLETA
ncbi:hypothetical protein LRP52_16565 [Photobacterium sp. ZSDE20]|uniref:Uncharacterized protein n=1 Tax=Photobacterium pectinilyticum TaxID=2906793 RepID=A0ABT1N2G0_9GAMM|nr:hypothetical protein [Photobacterium sp. ZSDE20]MCQ1058900.1 hypothetical protein [Photobacterium sp. ZSDE20]MDD1823810.1 hypothetical protein [Photobacterium sp. ZSDE20]